MMMPFSNGYDPTDERMEAATLDQECPFYTPPTNADRIRSMSNEELACLLDSFRCGNCMRRGNNCFPSDLRAWLRRPAEGVNNV